MYNIEVNEGTQNSWSLFQKKWEARDRKLFHHAYQLTGLTAWLLAGMAPQLGPAFGYAWRSTHCQNKMNEELAASVHTDWTTPRRFVWSLLLRSDTHWSQRLVSSQVGSFMFFKTLLTILSSSFLARCSSSSVLFILLLSWRDERKRSGGMCWVLNIESHSGSKISQQKHQLLLMCQWQIKLTSVSPK